MKKRACRRFRAKTFENLARSRRQVPLIVASMGTVRWTSVEEGSHERFWWSTAVIEIGVIGGDGIGPEVVRAGMKVLEAASSDDPSLELNFTEFPWGCEYYLEHGRMMPEDGLETLVAFDEIYLGAVGWPTVPDHISLWGLLLPIRRTFDQYVNLRPARLLQGVKSPLADPGDPDITVVRENTEGEYSDSGGRVYRDTPYEIAVQESIFTRRGVERIIRYAFEEAKARRGLLVGATKSNGISITMPFFDEIFNEIAADYPDVEASLMHADALAARLVLAPGSFDVVVGSNLFGDLLSEITAAITGAIGIAPSANLNPEGKFPSLFEPIHGSAPDIAGQGVANPAGAIWAGALMLDHAGYPEAGARVLTALEDTLASGTKTRDLGGTASTDEMADAVTERLLNPE
jgi:tartrate dehydrogenase/decarboxylase / D-malate dehydrogenase